MTSSLDVPVHSALVLSGGADMHANTLANPVSYTWAMSTRWQFILTQRFVLIGLALR
jgi:hypothetical protein